MPYNKNVWVAGDVITAGKANKVENQVEALTNELEAARVVGGGTNGTLGERLDNMIVCSDVQPSSAYNELWVRSTTSGVQVPTYDEFEDVKDSIAEEYSATKEYAIGDYVYHTDGSTGEIKLYRCTTAIGSGGEAWTAAHWIVVVMTKEIIDMQSTIEYILSLLAH